MHYLNVKFEKQNNTESTYAQLTSLRIAMGRNAAHCSIHARKGDLVKPRYSIFGLWHAKRCIIRYVLYFYSILFIAIVYFYIYLFNLCSFLLYIFCFYSIFDHL